MLVSLVELLHYIEEREESMEVEGVPGAPTTVTAAPIASGDEAGKKQMLTEAMSVSNKK